jgi:hypothetical protein
MKITHCQKYPKKVSHNYNNTNIYTSSSSCLTPSSVILRAANPLVNLRAGESRSLFLRAGHCGKSDFSFNFIQLGIFGSLLPLTYRRASDGTSGFSGVRERERETIF